MELEWSWHLIPDGISTIVEVKMRGEFAVESANAETQAREVIVPFIARVTGQPAEAINDAILAEMLSDD